MGKRKVYLIIAVLAVLSAAIFIYQGEQGGGQAFSSEHKSLPEESPGVFPPVDKTSYHMGIYLDTAALTLSGKSVIHTQNNCSRPLKELYFTVYPNAFKQKSHTPAPLSAYRRGFDPGSIEIIAVEVEQKPVEFFCQGISLQVLLPEDILPGQDLDIRMHWQVKIPQAAYRFGARDGVIMLSNFYPILNVKRGEEWLLFSNVPFGDPFCFQAANYLVKVNVPSEFQVIASGSMLGREAEASGRDTLLIEAREARDFVLVASCQHQVLQTKVMETMLKCHVLPGEEAMGRKMLAQAARIFEYYACTFGSYPYSEFDIIQVPMLGFQGMEYSGVIFLQKEAFSRDFNPQQRDFLLAHEIAHQWWFGLVGNDQVREPWLDEGLANWSARRYLQDIEGQSFKESYSVHQEADLSRTLQDMATKGEYLNTAYKDGEAFWSALEKELGAEKVIKILRRYLAQYRGQIATTENLKEVIQEEVGGDMGTFFQKWFKN